MDSKFKEQTQKWFDDGFKAGQQNKQAEIDALKARIQELWTELDDRQSKEYIIERCESIIKDILNDT